MIKGTLKLGGDLIEVIIKGNEVLFSDCSSGVITTIEGLKLDKSGVLNEFPDLKENKDWRKEATKRFKKHTRKFKTETKKIEYIKKELSKHGYEPLIKQRAGWRPEKWQ